jgi:antitoxin ParD1/3/4
MPSDQTRNVSLTAELNAFIRVQVASGHYQNASEVVRAGLRLLAQQTDREALPTLPRADEPPRTRAAARGRHARQV